MEEPPKNLVAVWRYVAWLDQAYTVHLGNRAKVRPLIPGPVFDHLEPDRKILSHWLCYTMDAQTDYRRLWTLGGPVIAEFVDAYSKSNAEPLDLLAGFADDKAEQKGKLATLLAKRQRAEGDKPLAVTPRYSWMVLSTATTVVTLDRFRRSIIEYLAVHGDFLSEAEGEIVDRLAFLLYRLTYSGIVAQKDCRLRSQSFRTAAHRHSQQTLRVLASRTDMRAEFEKWRGSNRRYHKRLWAALRDYMKQGGEYYAYFHDALSNHGLGHLAEHFDSHQHAIRAALEVPGDVWNLRFFERVFGNRIRPAQMREWYAQLRTNNKLPDGATVEQFDVSFRYSPAMCEERREECCVFRADSHIWDYCPPRRGVEWQDSPCPVTDHLCGIEYPCRPTDCPVREAVPGSHCLRGCRIGIQQDPTPAGTAP